MGRTCSRDWEGDDRRFSLVHFSRRTTSSATSPARARIARTRRERARETLDDRRGERRRHTDASRRLVDARTVEDIKTSREVVAVLVEWSEV